MLEEDEEPGIPRKAVIRQKAPVVAPVEEEEMYHEYSGPLYTDFIAGND
jgi:hypothetical protein